MQRSLDERLFFRQIVCVPRVEPPLQPVDRRVEFLLDRMPGRAIHRRVPAPLLRSLAQDGRHRAPVRMLAALGTFEGSKPLEHEPAFLHIFLPQPGLRLEIFTARLVGRLRGLVKALPVGLRIADDSLADRFPFVLQPLDPIGESLGRFLRSNKCFHLLDQLRALGRHGVILPLLELMQLHIEL